MIRVVLSAGIIGVTALAACPTAVPTAQAAPGVVVSPGMEIRQASNVCTLGYVDPVARVAYSAGHCQADGPVTDRDGRFPVARVAYSAGHCQADGPVTDRDGRFIGMVTNFQDNTPDGAVVRTDQVISDYEMIALGADVAVNNILPGGRQLVAEAAPPMANGQPVCHFGVITGESCGSIERVNNGWFTMQNGVVSQKGDSGGPVYMPIDNNKAVIVGLFNSTWGNLPAAVSWVATSQQVRAGADVVNVAAAADDQR
ncbi:Rv1815 family serine proteinase [Mycolicibacterium crocinum]|uniref:Rv1815 family serine proteinase n=1 Tax=Mycolicibacterium crocinum TaxID=388459 RepID=UPI0035572F17